MSGMEPQSSLNAWSKGAETPYICVGNTASRGKVGHTTHSAISYLGVAHNAVGTGHLAMSNGRAEIQFYVSMPNRTTYSIKPIKHPTQQRAQPETTYYSIRFGAHFALH
ncbi:MAG: hypothetical protein NTX25_23535 [Proteobacteria bacterium]|nr:hypothetical protein [Pseudomonadota bacterium]